MNAIAKDALPTPYHRLRAVNVSDRTEKKNGMTYLSWAYAVDQLLQEDPAAVWEYPAPAMYGETMMVFCAVTAFAKTMTAQLPVMDHRNKPVANPDSFAVNTAMQRCLVKAIALHGLGLYIYAGEDLPGDAANAEHEPAAVSQQKVADAVASIKAILAKDIDEDAQCSEIFDAHLLLTRDTNLYIAVADALVAQKILTKAQWKAAVAKGQSLVTKPF